MRNLAYSSVTTVPIAHTAAGTGEIDGSSIDTVGFQGLRFVAVLGTLTAGQQTILKAQGSLDGATNWTDLAATHVGPPADPASNETLILDLFRPGFRFVRPVVTRAAQNAEIICVLADLYLAAQAPITPDSTNAGTNVQAYPQGGIA